MKYIEYRRYVVGHEIEDIAFDAVISYNYSFRSQVILTWDFF